MFLKYWQKTILVLLCVQFSLRAPEGQTSLSALPALPRSEFRRIFVGPRTSSVILPDVPVDSNLTPRDQVQGIGELPEVAQQETPRSAGTAENTSLPEMSPREDNVDAWWGGEGEAPLENLPQAQKPIIARQARHEIALREAPTKSPRMPRHRRMIADAVNPEPTAEIPNTPVQETPPEASAKEPSPTPPKPKKRKKRKSKPSPTLELQTEELNARTALEQEEDAAWAAFISTAQLLSQETSDRKALEDREAKEFSDILKDKQLLKTNALFESLKTGRKTIRAQQRDQRMQLEEGLERGVTETQETDQWNELIRQAQESQAAAQTAQEERIKDRDAEFSALEGEESAARAKISQDRNEFDRAIGQIEERLSRKALKQDEDSEFNNLIAQEKAEREAAQLSALQAEQERAQTTLEDQETAARQALLIQSETTPREQIEQERAAEIARLLIEQNAPIAEIQLKARRARIKESSTRIIAARKKPNAPLKAAFNHDPGFLPPEIAAQAAARRQAKQEAEEQLASEQRELENQRRKARIRKLETLAEERAAAEQRADDLRAVNLRSIEEEQRLRAENERARKEAAQREERERLAAEERINTRAQQLADQRDQATAQFAQNMETSLEQEWEQKAQKNQYSGPHQREFYNARIAYIKDDCGFIIMFPNTTTVDQALADELCFSLRSRQDIPLVAMESCEDPGAPLHSVDGYVIKRESIVESPQYSQYCRNRRCRNRVPALFFKGWIWIKETHCKGFYQAKYPEGFLKDSPTIQNILVQRGANARVIIGNL